MESGRLIVISIYLALASGACGSGKSDKQQAAELDNEPRGKKCRSAQRYLRAARAALTAREFYGVEISARKASEECPGLLAYRRPRRRGRDRSLPIAACAK